MVAAGAERTASRLRTCHLNTTDVLPSHNITGLDISHSFVRIATDNARQAGVSIDFRHGDVTNMPFPADSFNVVACQVAFKNFPDPVAALDEIHRVLRPVRASRSSICAKTPRVMRSTARCDMHLSAPNAFFTRWTFRLGLLRAAFHARGARGGRRAQPPRTRRDRARRDWLRARDRATSRTRRRGGHPRRPAPPTCSAGP